MSSPRNLPVSTPKSSSSLQLSHGPSISPIRDHNRSLNRTIQSPPRPRQLHLSAELSPIGNEASSVPSPRKLQLHSRDLGTSPRSSHNLRSSSPRRNTPSGRIRLQTPWSPSSQKIGALSPSSFGATPHDSSRFHSRLDDSSYPAASPYAAGSRPEADSNRFQMPVATPAGRRGPEDHDTLSAAFSQVEALLVNAHKDLLQGSGHPPAPEANLAVRLELCDKRLQEILHRAMSLEWALGLSKDGTAPPFQDAKDLERLYSENLALRGRQRAELLDKTEMLFECIREDSYSAQMRIERLVHPMGELPISITRPGGGETPLDYAVLNGKAESARTLLKLGANIMDCKTLKTDPARLVKAARDKGISEVLSHLEARGRSRQVCEELFEAIAMNRQEQVQQLLGCMADINCRDQLSQLDPLGWAVRYKLEVMALYLIDQGAGFTQTTEVFREAIESGLLQVVKRLIEVSFDIMRRDENGWTPLDWAVTEGQEDIAIALLEAGGWQLADGGRGWLSIIRLGQSKNMTKLIQLLEQPKGKEFGDAVQAGDAAKLKVLIERDHCDPNMRSNFGRTGKDPPWTPLDFCVANAREDLALNLLEWTADPLMTTSGLPGLLKMVLKNNDKVSQLTKKLLKLKADINAPDDVTGLTPLETAVRLQREEMGLELLKLKANPELTSCGSANLVLTAATKNLFNLAQEIARSDKAAMEALHGVPEPPSPGQTMLFDISPGLDQFGRRYP